MKIWITRHSAFSIQCGGLERLQVWFRKPVFVNVWRTEKQDDIPWEMLNDTYGRKISQWQADKNGTTWIETPVSCGKLFGYGGNNNENDKLVTFIWDKLMEHFGNVGLRKIDEYEKEHEECCIKNFLLEIDIKVEMVI